MHEGRIGNSDIVNRNNKKSLPSKQEAKKKRYFNGGK